MVWLKVGDTAGTHPITMRGGIGGDERQTNELFGFVIRCALNSSAHLTDGFIDESVTHLFGGQHTDRLCAAAKKAGYWKPQRRDGHKGWMLVQDPDYLHIRLKDEISWEKQQKADAANPYITVPVRLRDGDACRYCGQIVQWTARRGGRRGTYDHRPPGQPGTIDTMVVACGSCNFGRSNDPLADEKYPLRPPPADPFYSELTAIFLREHGRNVTPNVQRPRRQRDTADPKRPRTQRDNAPSSTAGQRRPGSQPDTAPVSDPAAGGTPHDSNARAPTRSADSAEIQPSGSGEPGSGRDGSERVGSGPVGVGVGDGSGRAGSGAGGAPQPRRSRRGRRRDLTEDEIADLAYPEREPPESKESSA